MIFRVRHATRFDYAAPAYESHNEVRLRPCDDSAGQLVLSFELDVQPHASVFEFRDYFGNRAYSISIYPPHPSLAIRTVALVERLPDLTGQPIEVLFDRYLADDDTRTRVNCEFLTASRFVPFSDRLRKFFWMARPRRTEDVAEYVMRVVCFIRDQFGYDTGTTHVHSNLDEILNAGGGVCQDFAHLTLGVLRLAGVPARYVSGYMGPHPDSNGTQGEQASHAWIEALLPGAGWTGFDPTHRCRTDIRHIRVAIGRDYADAAPIRGVYRSDASQNTMSVDLEVYSEASGPSSGQSQQQ
jgi:transglutaminase-like putative cysteine protease